MSRCTTCALLFKEPFAQFEARSGGIDEADAYHYVAYFDPTQNVFPFIAAYCYGQEPQFERQASATFDVKSIPIYDLIGEEHDCKFYQLAMGHLSRDDTIEIFHRQKVQMSAPAPNVQIIQNSGILNINSTLSNVTQSLRQNKGLDEAKRDELLKLFEELKEVLGDTPPTHVESAEIIADQAAEISKELERTPPRGEMLRIKGEGLIEATKALVYVIPAAISIAQKIAEFVSGPAS